MIDQDAMNVTCPCCKYHYEVVENKNYNGGIQVLSSEDLPFSVIDWSPDDLPFYRLMHSVTYVCPKCGIWFQD